MAEPIIVIKKDSPLTIQVFRSRPTRRLVAELTCHDRSLSLRPGKRAECKEKKPGTPNGAKYELKFR